MNTQPPAGYDPTSLEAAQANVLASSTAQCQHMNDELKALYAQAFSNWKVSVDAGRIEPKDPLSSLYKAPPVPPLGYVVKDAGGGWFFPAPGSAPVCDPLPLPESMLTPKPPGPMLPPANVRNCLPGDTAPAGFVVLDSDGARWQKQATATPFGVAWYYVKL